MKNFPSCLSFVSFVVIIFTLSFLKVTAIVSPVYTSCMDSYGKVVYLDNNNQVIPPGGVLQDFTMKCIFPDGNECSESMLWKGECDDLINKFKKPISKSKNKIIVGAAISVVLLGTIIIIYKKNRNIL